MKTQNEMTAKERIIGAIEGRETDRIPFSPFLAYVWEYWPQTIQEKGCLAFLQEIGADPLWRGAPCPVRVEVPGVEVKTRQEGTKNYVETITPVGTLHNAWCTTPEAGVTPFQFIHPLKTKEDYKTQLWIEEHTKIIYDPKSMDDFFAGDGREGLSLGMLCFRGKTAFQSMIESYCGTEELTRALLMEFPGTARELHQAMLANNLKCAELAAQSPYEYLLTFEDSSTQNYSPAMYEEYIAPEIRRYCEILAGCGKSYVQHACGHVRHLLGSMADCGVKAVESISAPPTGNIGIKEAREIIGGRMGIIGGIEPMAFLNTDYEDLPRYVEQVIEDAQGGPFILANSDSCPPGVTPEKFKLIADLVRERK